MYLFVKFSLFFKSKEQDIFNIESHVSLSILIGDKIHNIREEGLVPRVICIAEKILRDILKWWH